MYKLDQPPLLFESSRPGRATAILPPVDVPDRPLDEIIPRRSPRGGKPCLCPSSANSTWSGITPISRP